MKYDTRESDDEFQKAAYKLFKTHYFSTNFVEFGDNWQG